MGMVEEIPRGTVGKTIGRSDAIHHGYFIIHRVNVAMHYIIVAMYHMGKL
jgi:hypothetical protein